MEITIKLAILLFFFGIGGMLRQCKDLQEITTHIDATDMVHIPVNVAGAY